MEKIIKKAEILIDALPFIRKFYGKTFVIKYGGAAQTKEELKESFAKDVVMLNYIGIRTVIVHGGGPRISATMAKMGKTPEFVQGQRVTDQETMDIVEMAYVVDCIDSLACKEALVAESFKRGLKIASSMGAGNR